MRKRNLLLVVLIKLIVTRQQVPGRIYMENAGCQKCNVVMEMIYYQLKGTLRESSNWQSNIRHISGFGVKSSENIAAESVTKWLCVCLALGLWWDTDLLLYISHWWRINLDRIQLFTRINCRRDFIVSIFYDFLGLLSVLILLTVLLILFSAAENLSQWRPDLLSSSESSLPSDQSPGILLLKIGIVVDYYSV